MIKFKPRFEKLVEANLPNSKELAKQYGFDYIVKLNYNENKFGATPKIKGSLKINSSNIYPEFKTPILNDKLAEVFDMKKDNFYVSNGSDSILDLIPTLFASATLGQNIIIPELTYGRIALTATINNVNLIKVPMKNYEIDLEGMLNSINEDTAIIYLVNPNMPTGTVIGKKELKEFIKKVPSHILIVIDNAYSEYAFGIKEAFALDKSIVEEFDNVIITHTLSKLFGLASFRIGYLVSNPRIVDLFRRAAQYLPVNKYSLQVSRIAMDDLPYYDDVISKTNVEKNYLMSEFDALGVKYIESNGNFIFIETINEEYKNAELREYILKTEGVVIRNVRKIGLRLTVGTHEENLKVIRAMKRFINDKSR
ncbi:pyridoxal phosphate-dependent aminotransferase [Mycoplasma todarodis]|uniref:pyridoxal phosphate-dependent aminotransferase n=1 Tax=Mycoplasma todarodis TaxID=1937191 RepID=UPI003B366C63